MKPLFKWNKGRQDSGYYKMLLAYSKWLKFDFYLIKFPEGSEIKPHVDKVESGKHFRLNIVIKKSKIGGIFNCDETIVNTSRIKFFRPDKFTHSVSKIEKGNRYILSLGWIRN